MDELDQQEQEITRSIIGAFFAVYRELRFGFFAQLYAEALTRELVGRGHHVVREASVRVFFRGEELGSQKLDMIVDDQVIVEIKSTEKLHPTAPRQLYSYLRSTNLEIGLVLHFGPTPEVRRLICRNIPSPPHRLSSPPHPQQTVRRIRSTNPD